MAKKKDALKALLLFSDTLPGPVREKVLRIPGGGASQFRTSAFADPDSGRIAWLEARKDAENSWTVQRHERMPDSVYAPVAIMSGACFFDALHYCARFEATEEDSHEPGALDESVAAFPHYSAAAAAAFQPLDFNGLPHPAAEGSLLTTGGLFEDGAQARAMAGKTASVALLPEKPSMALAKITDQVFSLPADYTENALIATAAGRVMALAQQEKEIRAALPRKSVTDRAQELKNQWNNAYDNLRIEFRKSACSEAEFHAKKIIEDIRQGIEFKFTPFFKRGWGGASAGVLITLATAGLIIPVHFLMYSLGGGNPDVYPVRNFDVRYKRLLSCEKRMADSDIKTATGTFNKAVFMTFLLENAAVIYQNSKGKKQKKVEKAIEKALDFIDKASAAAPLDDEKREAMRTALRSDMLGGRFPAPGTKFLPHLEKMSDALRTQLNRKIEEIEQMSRIEFAEARRPKLALPPPAA